jgi:hypothetical protein
LGTVVPHDDHGALSGLTDDDHTQYLKEKASGGLASETPTHTHADANNCGTLDAAAIASGRFGVTRLNWTANKLLKGAGTGADPTEIDVPSTPLVATDELRNSNDTQKTTTSTSYVKLKETKLGTVPAGLTSIRISFDLNGNGGTVYARVYRNGAAIGTERSTTSVSPVTFTEDFTTTTWAANDLIQLYAHVVTSGTVYVQNFRFYYGVQIPTTNQDP